MSTKLGQFVPNGRVHVEPRSTQKAPPKEGFLKGLVRGIKEAVVGPTAAVSASPKRLTKDAFLKDGTYQTVATKNYDRLVRGTRGNQPSAQQLADYCSQVIQELAPPARKNSV